MRAARTVTFRVTAPRVETDAQARAQHPPQWDEFSFHPFERFFLTGFPGTIPPPNHGIE